MYSAFLPKLSDINHTNQQIFSQLYYSIETLTDTGYSGKVFLFYDADVDIKNFLYKKKYSLKKFSNLVCVRANYDENIIKKTKCAFHKWYYLKLFYDKFKFNRVLCVDNDTIFNKNPEIIFNENSDLDVFYGKQYRWNDDLIKEKLNMEAQCLNTGQFLVSSKIMQVLGDKFLEDVLENYFLTLKITNEFKKDLAGHMIWIGEEYAITKTLEEKKIKIINLSDKYATYSGVNKKPVFCHYYSCNTRNAVPEEYWSIHTSERTVTWYSHLAEKETKKIEKFQPILNFYKKS